MLSQGPVIGVLKIMSQLPELVQALLKPGSYPHSPQAGKMGQTQMSFLLLTGGYNAPLFRRRVADQFGPGAKRKVGKFKGALA